MRIRGTMSSNHHPTHPRSYASGKRAANLTLSADILTAAKALNINISQVCDAHLREVVQGEQDRRWREEHTEFISVYLDARKAPSFRAGMNSADTIVS